MGKDAENITVGSKDHWKNYYNNLLANFQKLLVNSSHLSFSVEEVEKMENGLAEIRASVAQLKNKNKENDDEFNQAVANIDTT